MAFVNFLVREENIAPNLTNAREKGKIKRDISGAEGLYEN